MTSLAAKLAHPAPAFSAGETLALQIDAFVMAVTESLCIFEKSSPVMEQRANRERKTRILAGLGELDRMVCALRDASAHMAALDLPSGGDRTG